MTKKKKEEQIETKKSLEETIECDYNRMCGNINEAIRYLTEIRDKYEGKDISFDATTSGYDNVELSFGYLREETDDEFACRLQCEERQRQYAREDARRKADRARDLKELERLKSKLGIWR